MKQSLPLFLFVVLVSACATVPSLPTSTPAPSATQPLTFTPNPSATFLQPTLTATATSTSVPFVTPTIFQYLLHRMQGEHPSLPDGLLMDIYSMPSGPFPDEGYDPFLRSLGEQSQLHSLTQGRYSWDTADLALLEKDNAALVPFGYRLVSQPVTEFTGSRWFTLYQGDKVILDPIYTLGQVSVNRSGTDFLLVVDTVNGFQLVRKGSLETWNHINGWIGNSSPQFLGDDVMHVEIHEGTPAASAKTLEPSSTSAEVFRQEEVIYTRQYENRPAGSGLIGFWTYKNHWALETIDHVVIDGQDVNAMKGYDKSYEFHLLGGKPLFFFEKSGKLNISFNNKTALLPFSVVPHYGCCSAGLVNPLQIGDVLLLYGVQGESWYYVEITSQ